MTITRPLRLMILPFSQIRFTDGFTFIVICPLFDIVSLVILLVYHVSTVLPSGRSEKSQIFFHDGQNEQPGSFESVGYTAAR